MSADALDDVADSTDWLSTPLPGLSAVESALRCQLCKEFYQTPMLTSCNHTFCSICIRRALSNDGKCPLCRSSEQEMKLRSNWSMEEVVEAFTKARRSVLEFAQKPPPALPTVSSRSESPKRKLDDTEVEIEASNKRLRSSTRISKSKGAEAAAEMARLEADIPDPSNDPAPEPDDGLVACPICTLRMKETLVFQHLDTSCPGEVQSQPRAPRQRNQSFPILNGNTGQPPKTYDRLPAINYSMMKETQLRKKLRELGISDSGNRQMLEKRHKEWTTIWNANCDSLHPRRKGELLQDLDSWERTLGSRASTLSRSAHVGAQIKDKDFDGAAWAAKHDTSFKDLIANARKNRGPKISRSSTEEDDTVAKVEDMESGPEPGKGISDENQPPANPAPAGGRYAAQPKAEQLHSNASYGGMSHTTTTTTSSLPPMPSDYFEVADPYRGLPPLNSHGLPTSHAAMGFQQPIRASPDPRGYYHTPPPPASALDDLARHAEARRQQEYSHWQQQSGSDPWQQPDRHRPW